MECCIAKIHKFLINHTVSAVFCKAARRRRRRAKKPSHFLRWREGRVLVYHKKNKKVGRDSDSYDLEFPVWVAQEAAMAGGSSINDIIFDSSLVLIYTYRKVENSNARY